MSLSLRIICATILTTLAVWAVYAFIEWDFNWFDLLGHWEPTDRFGLLMLYVAVWAIFGGIVLD